MRQNKQKTIFICQNCGMESLRWQGKCPDCGEWNSFVEEIVRPKKRSDNRPERQSEVIPLSEIKNEQHSRIQTVSPEFNRVLGGGIVPGSVILIGGDPGIGKSTLLLQEAAGLATSTFKILYVTGEESLQQTKMRSQRLNLNSESLFIFAETELESILNTINSLAPNIIIIDSIQTTYLAELSSAPGSISQVRECAFRLIQIAKTQNIPVFIIGHVTKEGYIAGPRVLEHMVDCLLLFEGDREHFYRILRAAKNRFGSTREIGVFEMTDHGLADVNNPSEQFLSERQNDSPGTTVVSILEGTRSILVEIQALITSSHYGLPQRSTTGLDPKRVSLLIAVLEKRIGMNIGMMDVFVNVVGGLHITETSADLGVLTCMASSMRNCVVDPSTVILGEVGLGGEVRAISQIDKRIAEIEKMGFKKAVIPKANVKNLKGQSKLEVYGIKHSEEALEITLN